MNPTTEGWPRISSVIFYRDAGTMIDWLCAAFGFEIRLKIEGEGGHIEHSELTYGGDGDGDIGVVMVGSERLGAGVKFGVQMLSPLTASGNTQSLMLHVDDVDAHCERARKLGAKIVDEPSVHDYGEQYWSDRSYGASDPEGHFWWFTQRLRNPPKTSV